MLGVSRDITERKRTEAELHALSNRLVRIQEEERQNVARELHDQIGQLLTALKLLLDSAMKSPTDKTVTEAQKVLDELMLRIRNLSLDLRPKILDDLGLLPALLWHFERYTTQTHIAVNFRQRGLQSYFPSEVRTAAYRIVQEALTNVARHAKVKKVSVRAWADENTLSLQIEDSGAGFDYASLPVGVAGGLSSMRERALLLGGKLEIESTPGVGTTVLAELPLKH